MRLTTLSAGVTAVALTLVCDLTPVDFGLVVGGGVESRRLSLEARYTLGLRTVFHDGDLEGTFKNRSFSVLAGFRIGR
jgi:hypothetical protein